ncbi:MAG: ABC transporter substrate-binding protein [Desulfobacteraceae bacterium]|jgi:NitT/TauT family transport system substrate-binding protein
MKYPIGTTLILSLVIWGATGLWDHKAEASDDAIVYRLKWLKNMSTVGDLYAEENGYFKSQGLDVTIKAGGPEKDSIRELELGYAQFGVASADQIIRALTRGAPVVVVAQLFQINPLQWIYRQDRISITRLADLKGRRLGVTFGKNDEIIMRTLLERAQIRQSQVTLFSVRLDYTPFYKGQVDLWPVYINTQGVEIGGKLRAAGEQIRFFNPNDFGVRFVANSVVTSEKMINQHPDVVKRFVCALLRGWEEAMMTSHQDRSIAVVKRYDRDTSLEVLEQQLLATRKLILPTQKSVIGKIDRNAWQETEKIMLDHKQIPKPVFVVKRLYPEKCK